MRDVCIIIPAYNEEAAIAQTIADYRAHFPDAEIIVVDNNSSDNTHAVAAAALAGDNGFVLSEPRQGKGFAVKRALSRRAANIFIMTDGDLTYPASEARRLYELCLKARADMVVGDRVSEGAYQSQNRRFGHNLGNQMLTWLISALSGRRYFDVLSGLRVMSAPFVSMLDVRSEGFQIETEINIIAAHLRADIVEEPIEYKERPQGSQSKLNTIKDGLKISIFALKNWVAFLPMQPFLILSVFTGILAAALVYRVVVAFIASGLTEMPYPSSAVAAAALGIVSFQSLFTGVDLMITGRNQRRRDIADFLDRKRRWNNTLDGRAI